MCLELPELAVQSGQEGLKNGQTLHQQEFRPVFVNLYRILFSEFMSSAMM
ncbi:MAG: hypothetical protein AAGF98_10830 [Cyanobacteria bacterium P01_H01_bin.153]